MRLHVLPSAAQVLRRVHGEPDALVAVRMQPPLARELRKRGLLVVALLGQERERLLAENVDAGVDPVVEQRGLAETGDRAVALDLHHPKRGAHLRDDDRRCGAAPIVFREERGEVEIEQLVAVERENRAFLAATRRREAKPAAAAERLLLPDRLDLGAEPGERGEKRLFVPRAARDDDTRHAALDEAGDRILREREASDRHERLRQSLRRVAEPFRLAAAEEERLHQAVVSRSGDGCGLPLTPPGVALVGRPMPSYSKPAAAAAAGSRRFRPSTMSGRAIASRTSAVASSCNSGHSVTITAASASRTASRKESQIWTPWRSSGRATGSQARTSAPSVISRDAMIRLGASRMSSVFGLNASPSSATVRPRRLPSRCWSFCTTRRFWSSFTSQTAWSSRNG